jgi:hypothetical protein
VVNFAISLTLKPLLIMILLLALLVVVAVAVPVAIRLKFDREASERCRETGRNERPLGCLMPYTLLCSKPLKRAWSSVIEPYPSNLLHSSQTIIGLGLQFLDDMIDWTVVGDTPKPKVRCTAPYDLV